MKTLSWSKVRTDFPGLLEKWSRGFHPPRWKFHLPRRPAERPLAIEPPSVAVAYKFRCFSKWAAIIAIVVSYHVLFGWAFDIEILKRLNPGWSTMKANTALALALAGIALFFLQDPRAEAVRARNRMIAKVCASLCTLIGLLTVFEYLFGWNMGIDQLLVSEPEGMVGTPFPGRMSPMTAEAVTMTGAALLLLDWESPQRQIRPAELLALVSGALSLLAICGYLYGAVRFYRFPNFSEMSLYSAVILLLLSFAILCARPDRGLMSRVTSDSFGGLVARRLLLVTLFLPVILGWFRYLGEQKHLFSPEVGLALFVLASVVVFTGAVWWSVNSLHRMDATRRQTEAALRDTASKLERSNADLQQFAYVASHDLQEPLRAISGCVQLLQQQYQDHIDARANEVIKHVVDGVTRMQTLINDLLTYSRLTTREAPLERTNSLEILKDALANLDWTLKQNNAVVTHDPMPTVRVDRTQLVQVFQNLIGNALKYRSERTPKIHIGVQEKVNEWVFFVRDNGIGISPQFLDRIFRIFQRLHTRKEYPGTGIGLAVCKKVVERHGGHIWVESELEEGSTFFFTVPK